MKHETKGNEISQQLFTEVWKRGRSLVSRFYTNRRVFSKLIFPGSYGLLPRILSFLGKVSFMSWLRAEFPERVVNRIMKT